MGAASVGGQEEGGVSYQVNRSMSGSGRGQRGGVVETAYGSDGADN